MVFVFNADNTALFGDFSENVNFFFRGTAKFSVPPGHYWAVGDFLDFSARNKPSAERAVVLPQFTVRKDKTVHMAEQDADSQVAISTPRPSVVVGTSFDLRRIPRAGRDLGLRPGGVRDLSAVGEPDQRPGPPSEASRITPISGGCRRPDVASPYEYDLAYGATGIIPRQEIMATPGSLATVHARYYSDVTSGGDVVATGLFRPQFNDEVFGPAYRVRMPRTQTEYLTGNPAVTWWQGMGQYTEDVFGLQRVSGGQFGGPKVYHAGQHLTRNWDAYPLHTGVSTRGGVALLGAGVRTATPSATRAGNVLNLQVTPFSDSNGDRGRGSSTTTVRRSPAATSLMRTERKSPPERPSSLPARSSRRGRSCTSGSSKSAPGPHF